MPTLKIVLLGRPQFLVDGVEATGFNTRKDCALLAYLAATGNAHSREHLAGLLWPDVPEAAARRNLRHSLSYIQKVIGPAWIETDPGVRLTVSLPAERRSHASRYNRSNAACETDWSSSLSEIIARNRSDESTR